MRPSGAKGWSQNPHRLRRSVSHSLPRPAQSLYWCSVLGDSRSHPVDDERRGIQHRLPGELELLPRVQGNRVAVVIHKEIGDQAAEALRLRLFDLFLGDFLLGLRDVDLGGNSGQGQFSRRQR